MKYTFILSLVGTLLFFSCAEVRKENQSTEQQYQIVVTHNVLFTFADELMPNDMDIVFPVPEGMDPAFYQPSEDDIQKIQKCDLMLINGADYEKWMKNLSIASSKVINTSSSATEMYIMLDEGPKHSHGPEGEHSHGGIAFTTWLDIEIARIQLNECKDALIKLFPELKDSILSKHFSMDMKLIDVNARSENAFKGLVNYQFFGSHPVYQYLDRANDLNMTSFHWEPEDYPGEEEWMKFEASIEKGKSLVMLWEKQPIAEIRLKLEELGVEIVVFNQGAEKRSDLDFFEVMDQNIQNLERIAMQNPNWKKLQ